MKIKRYAQLSLVPVLLSSPLSLLAGDLDSPTYPTRDGSAMYTIEDIYNRLDTGEEATTPRGGFTEPESGPRRGTGHTLTELYQKADEAMNQARVARTGQTTRYENGDDGDLEKGATGPSSRFTDNHDGTVSDNLTELTWLKNANCANETRSWEDTLDDVENLNENGTMNRNDCSDTSREGRHQTDWRLPNVKELQSLIDFSQAAPALPSGHPFSDV
jgi:hypothetical protein